MSEWRGVPLPSAILVINDSKGARACTAAVAANRLDYAARRGRFAERGEIEREPTRADEEAMRSNAERALDYISREGDFAWKGAGRQVDASLWDVSGPISREEALRSMTKAGCYIESVLSVDRRHADALGLSDKESMQRLVRSTWGESVEAWGAFARPSDVRWVAAYHTDGANGLHCHIYTWGAPGDLKPGQQIGREASRAAREVVFRRGYEMARAELGERRTWLRDLSRQNAARQLGGRVDEARVARLHAEGARRGWPERVPERPDWGGDAAVSRISRKLSDRLAEGSGRLSRDWKSKALSRDLTRALEVASPATREIAAAAAECERARVEVKGYVSDVYRDGESLVRKAREEYLSRLDHTNETSLVRGLDRERGRDGESEREERGLAAAESPGRRDAPAVERDARFAHAQGRPGSPARVRGADAASLLPEAQGGDDDGGAGPVSRRPRRKQRGYERDGAQRSRERR